MTRRRRSARPRSHLCPREREFLTLQGKELTVRKNRMFAVLPAAGLLLGLVAVLPAVASPDGGVTFVSPATSSLTGTVDVEVTAPATTTAVRFSMDGVAFAELTNSYAT